VAGSRLLSWASGPLLAGDARRPQLGERACADEAVLELRRRPTPVLAGMKKPSRRRISIERLPSVSQARATWCTRWRRTTTPEA